MRVTPIVPYPDVLRRLKAALKLFRLIREWSRALKIYYNLFASLSSLTLQTIFRHYRHFRHFRHSRHFRRLNGYALHCYSYCDSVRLFCRPSRLCECIDKRLAVIFLNRSFNKKKIRVFETVRPTL